MISAPAFWSEDTCLARLLSPLSRVVAAITARRVARVGWRAPVPVLCCGNATVGGAGKTTVTLDLAHRLIARGVAVHILTRGYGGSGRQARRVMPGDTADLSGDEALLLAAAAPTWIGADRAASAKAAIDAGAQVLVMDDGLQNAGLVKSMALLVVDGATGFGNGRVLPSGPLREPVAAAASRCRAAVVIGPVRDGALSGLPPGLPVLRAHLTQGPEAAALSGRRVLAFAGIAIPAKFFTTLELAGVDVAGRESFPDHHMFTAGELDRLEAKAIALDAVLVTTPKDAVRLPAAMPVQVVGVRLTWRDEAEVEALLDELLAVG